MQTRSSVLAMLLLAAVLFPADGAIGATGDYDGDGKSDVFWRNTSNGLNTLWKSANAATSQVVAPLTSQQWKLVGDGDFDGDGRSDVFWRNSSTGDNIIWKSADAAMPQLVMSMPSQDWKVAATGDFDGDGASDVFWRNTASGANRIWKSANAATPQTVMAVTNLDWTIVGAGDFSGDGKSDVFWRNTRSGANRIWLSGNAATPQAVNAISSQNWKAIAIGDFSGDGRSDVFWRNVFTGANRLWQSADATTPLATAAVTDAGWVVIGAGDFDGDGRADVFWRNLHSGADEIWKSGKASTPQAVAAVRNPNWIVVPRHGQVFSALFITDVSIAEGNSGTQQAIFKIRLSQASAVPVTYSIDAHDDDVSSATAGSDYAAKHLTEQTIAAGETSKAFAVTIRGDTAAEANETFRVVIYEADAPIIYDVAIGKILNDDANALWIADARTVEGDSGTRPLTFTIRLSRPSSSAVTYDIATTAGYPFDVFAATPGEDYVARSLRGQTIPAGATSRTFTVSIIGDTVREIIGENFKVTVSNVVGATVVDGQASGLILDDEAPVIP